MAVGDFDSIKGHKGSNVRKILELAIFIKPYSSTSTPITSIYTGVSGGLVLPVGFLPVGMVTKDDGATWTRDQESADVMSYGYGSPVRRDITSDVAGLSFVMQESNKVALGLYHGQDLSAVTTGTTATGGNVLIDRPSRPVTPRYEVLALGKDGDGPDAVYLARILPNAQVTEMPEQSWTEGEEVKYPATFTAYVHDAWGTSFREIWAGPGLKHVDMGFTAPAA